MHYVLLDKIGEKILLLGNEAIVRGALEAGVQFASTYPGTPASEIGDTFAEIAKDAGIYFEYSVNEKVAFEAAAGAALSGLRSMVSFKHFGLNVALDSVLPIAYVGIEGGLVVVFADDPNGWSSAQSEQDSRCFAKLAHMPMLEPSDPQECVDFVKTAYDLSEKTKLPVFVRLTTRIDHTRGIVNYRNIVKGDRKAKFVKDLKKFFSLPPRIIEMHKEISEKVERIREEFSEKSEMNRVVGTSGEKSKIGIITSGVSFNYVMDAIQSLGIELPVLKLGITYPLPERKIKDFIKNLDSVVIVEELEPYLEKEVQALAKDANPRLKILGKGVSKDGGTEAFFPVNGEYTPELVLMALGKAVGKKPDFDYEGHLKKFSKLKIPRRFPILCPGCPHRATFYAVKKAAGEDAIFGGDIGCYILAAYPPLETEDFILDMGASIGITHGIKKADDITGTKQKVIAFIGDSTFFHAGIPPLINAVFNKSNMLVVVLDNRVTAMTGHQPHPGTGVTAMGEPTEEIRIDDVARACGVKNVKVVDPYNMKEMMATVKEFLEKPEVSVIVAKHKCRLLEYRDLRRKGMEIPSFDVFEKLSEEEKNSIVGWGCPGFYKDEKGEMHIDKGMCWGCGLCTQLVGPGKIKPRKK